MNNSNSELSHSQSPATTIVLGPQTSVRQYTFQSSPVSPPVPPPRFVDSNPRPAKSPRHVAAPELPSNAPYPKYGDRFPTSYAATSEALLQRDSEYYSMPLSLQNWATTPHTSGNYGRAFQAPTSNTQHYAFPSEGYVKEETHTPQNYNWNPA